MQTIFKWRNELLVEVKMGAQLEKSIRYGNGHFQIQFSTLCYSPSPTVTSSHPYSTAFQLLSLISPLCSCLPAFLHRKGKVNIVKEKLLTTIPSNIFERLFNTNLYI